jgi:ribonuclease VapC
VIVIDSSALLAIILYEPDARRYADAIIDSEARSVSDFALFESRVVLHKRIGEVGSARLSALLRESRMTTVAFDEPQSNLAFDAYRRWGKGNRPAGLNLGDCVSYALAKSLNAPLLYKGEDFARTDVRRAL